MSKPMSASQVAEVLKDLCTFIPDTDDPFGEFAERLVGKDAPGSLGGRAFFTGVSTFGYFVLRLSDGSGL